MNGQGRAKTRHIFAYKTCLDLGLNFGVENFGILQGHLLRNMMLISIVFFFADEYKVLAFEMISDYISQDLEKALRDKLR